MLVDIGRKSPVYNVILTAEVENQLQKFWRDWLAGRATRNPTNRVIAFEYGHDHEWLASFTSWVFYWNIDSLKEYLTSRFELIKASGIEALVRGTLAFGLLTVDAGGWKRSFQAG